MVEIALAIVCAFSKPLCEVSKTVPIYQTRLPAGETGEYDWGTHNLKLSDAITNPAELSFALVHELTHAQQAIAFKYFPRERCMDIESEAYRNQGLIYRWFNDTFGPPQVNDTADINIDHISALAQTDMFLPVLTKYSCQVDLK